MSVVMPSAEDQADLFARRLAAISDAGMRIAYLRYSLLEMSAAEVADLLVVAHAYAEAKSTRHSALLAALSLALAQPSCAALRAEVAVLLRAREERQLARGLSQGPNPDDEGAQRVPDFGMGRPVTLGERKSLARKNDREWIARVIRDPHPQVMRILLLNPRVTESDVVRLCARRPVASDVLREVFLSARWIVRYPVKVALVLNPYTPLDVALQLAPLLRAQDLKRVLDASDLPTELHVACRRSSTRPGTLH
ncbi:MAG: hypothetical protein RL701_4846 [Pseudomonadota bacterium]|jgi:hypothetical protein